MQRIVKKLLCTLLAILLFVPLIGNFDHSLVLASSGKYKVAKVTDDCKFEEKASYNDFDDAVDKMEDLGGEYGDYVVLSDSSLSPMKIVAMNCGIAIAYPYRHGSVTLDIYSKLSSTKLSGDNNSAKTYVAANNMMVYHSTYAFYGSGSHGLGYDHGYIKVTLNGFTGYTDLEYCDLVPYKFIEKGKKATLGGNASGQYAYSKPEYSEVLNVTRYKVEKDGKYTDLCLEQNYIYGTSLQRETNHIGVAPSFMSTGKYYYSSDGINFYSDIRLKNFVGRYYNFYQFVPVRTYTHISKSKVKEYVNSKTGNTGALAGHGGDFYDSQNEFGFNAITALSLGIHESGWGKSDLAINRNNLFGIAAYDGNVGAAKTFSSVKACIDALMGDVLANYMDVNCQWYYSMSLGNKGGGFITSYASDPYWAEEVAQYYYAIDKYDNGNNGSLTDYNEIDFALVNSNTYFMKGNSSSSSKWYQTANKFGYQKNLFIPVLELTNNYVKTQLPTPISDSGNVIHTYSKDITTTVPYNKDKSIGYVDLNKVTLINCDEKYTEIPTLDPSKIIPFASVNSATLTENTLSIVGTAFIKNLNYTDLTKISHQLILKNLGDLSDAYVFDLETKEVNISLNDDYNYKYVGFSGNVDLSTVELGKYALYARVNIGDNTKDIEIGSSNDKYYNIFSEYEDVINRITTNEVYGYRLELEKISTPLDYSKVLKPAMNRISLFSYNSTDIDEELNINIYANAMIYYLDYDVPENISFEVYLIKNKTDYKALDTSLSACPIDYNEEFKPNHDMSNICFTATGNLSDLEGEYRMFVKISNTVSDEEGNETTYIDYVEMFKSSSTGLASIIVDNKIYEIYRPNNQDFTILVAGKEETIDEGE